MDPLLRQVRVGGTLRTRRGSASYLQCIFVIVEDIQLILLHIDVLLILMLMTIIDKNLMIMMIYDFYL